MRFRVCLIGVVCVLLAAVVMTGCGRKSDDVKSSEKADKQVVSKKDQPEPATKPDAKKEESASGQLPTSDILSGLPFDLTQAPSTLGQALNPMSALGKDPQAFSSVSGLAKALSAPPTAAPVKMEKPKPEQLLAILQMRYRSAKTFRTSGTSTGVVKADGKVVEKTSDPKSVLLFKRPDMFIMSGSDEELVSNGKTVVRYSYESKRFAKSKLDKEKKQQLMQGLVISKMGVGSMGLLMGVDYAPAVSSMKMLADSNIGGMETFVLVLNLKKGVGCPKDATATQTLWIGKKDFALYKNQVVAKIKPTPPKDFKGKAPKSVQTTVAAVATKCEFDPNIPDSKFTFNPPAGAKAADDPMKNYLQDKLAPDFAFTWTDGSQKKLSDFRGQFVVLDCWALPLCEKHLPTVQKFYGKHKDSVQLISICFNDDAEKVGIYLTEKGLNFPVIYANEEIGNFFQEKYHLQVIPTIFIIDKSGVVRERMLGMPQEKEITAKLDKLIQ